jgi:hypothetical protein
MVERSPAAIAAFVFLAIGFSGFVALLVLVPEHFDLLGAVVLWYVLTFGGGAMLIHIGD